MGRDDIKALLARNLAAAMAPTYGTNQSALAKAAGVSQKTVSNILRPLKTEAGVVEDTSGATIVVLDKLATVLGLKPWQLLHPHPDQAKREMDLYRKIEENYRQLPNRERDAFGGYKLGEIDAPEQPVTPALPKRK